MDYNGLPWRLERQQHVAGMCCTADGEKKRADSTGMSLLLGMLLILHRTWLIVHHVEHSEATRMVLSSRQHKKQGNEGSLGAFLGTRKGNPPLSHHATHN